ncbi:MAG: hypothetical protein ACKOZT_06020 [Cyanobium sp.]
MWCLVGALLALTPTGPAPAAASERCAGAQTTLAIKECLGRLLEQSDRSLERELLGVAEAIRRYSSDPIASVWPSFATRQFGTADPSVRLKAFQRERLRTCQYVNALSLQGSGFGLFVMTCELDINEALLRQFRP